MKIRLAYPLFAALFVVACNAENSGDGAPPPSAPVVVYASPAQEATLDEAFAQFTADTGIRVTLNVADGDANVSNVIENRGAPTADVLVTHSITDIWRAADEGALRPLTAPLLDTLPEVLKDPDGTWAAIGIRYAVIVAASDAESSQVDNYRDLATSELRGKVCLSSSALSINRSLVAMLVEDIGIKPAERMVRAWVRNLAASPFATEVKLVDALRSGDCRYGIVSSSVDLEGLSTVLPQPLYLDIEGIGVARHAEQADAAQALVQWMLESTSLPAPQSSNGRNLALVGWRAEDARLLADRAGYR